MTTGNLYSMTNEALLTQEKLSFTQRGERHFTIGIPKENRSLEKRLALTPEAVAILVEQGMQVIIEENSAQSIHYTNQVYSEAGAEICDQPERVWGCDIVLKVSIPMPYEIAWMKNKSVLMSLLQIGLFSSETLELMMEKKITALAYDFITDDRGLNPVINQIREIEGRTSVVVAADLLTNDSGGKGILMGGCAGVSPTEVLILGAGRAGSEAARTAVALGAQIKIFDYHIEALRSLQRLLGPSTFTSTLHPNVLAHSLKSADVVIGALRFESGERHFFVSNQMIQQMKRGAIIIDLCVDQGGCFETSICPKNNKEMIFEKFGVIHYCTPNISSRVARTTTIALSNHLLPLFMQLSDYVSISAFLAAQRSYCAGVYLYQGKMVNPIVAEHFGYSWSDIMIYLTSLQ